jgi:hypothetical protein
MDFRLNSFRAVLAHEYGHFSNRDTAGGDVAMRVNDHMMKFAQAMYEGGQAVWWNIAFQFLRIYHFIFRRLSHGATKTSGGTCRSSSGNEVRRLSIRRWFNSRRKTKRTASM